MSDPTHVWTISWQPEDDAPQVQVYATEKAALADLKRILAEDGWWEDYCRFSCGAMPDDVRKALEIVQMHCFGYGSWIDLGRDTLRN